MSLRASEFTSMSQVEQMELILDCAVFIGERTDELFHYLLHNIDGLYIEEVRFTRNNSWFSYMCAEDFDTLVKYAESVQLPC